METIVNQDKLNGEMTILSSHSDGSSVADEHIMGHRVCDNCSEEKDTSGGKSCSKGHFICHSCSSRHVHCPLCGHTLR